MGENYKRDYGDNKPLLLLFFVSFLFLVYEGEGCKTKRAINQKVIESLIGEETNAKERNCSRIYITTKYPQLVFKVVFQLYLRHLSRYSISSK